MTKKDLAVLKEIKRLVNYLNANFDSFGGENWRLEHKGNRTTLIEHRYRSEDGPAGREIPYSFTEFIKERTRSHRDSWINPLLDQLIERAEKKVNGSEETYKRRKTKAHRVG